MDFTPAEIDAISSTLLDGLRASPRGHQPTALEKLAIYAKYRQLREQRYGPLPARERTGVRNSLSQESPLVRRIFGG